MNTVDIARYTQVSPLARSTHHAVLVAALRYPVLTETVSDRGPRREETLSRAAIA
jgi:hypothetical protein